MNLVLSDRPLSLFQTRPGLAEYIDLSALRISNCVGCFGCWTRTPGRCVIRDDAVTVYPKIAASRRVLYVSRLFCGGYDLPMKTILERAIPVQQPFIRLVDGETHHFQRQVEPKEATILAYGEISPEEKQIFRRLVARNAKNMHFVSHRVLFLTEDQLEAAAEKEVLGWAAS